ncbi:G patch domain-containing protein 11 [Haematobia irritans]|uniref:G patch domain-containing protein 11 n=1 Tax=Haematobia irritans TaxID=7368 RepID=UPI003F50898A
MSDEEDDYMSDKFLNGLSDPSSLIKNRAKKRELMVESKQKEHAKKQRMQMNSPATNNEKLQKALSKPLEPDNKGFKLLAKMGYKPGQALGKAADDGEKATDTCQGRLVEPIGITIKSDRQGLGRETALKELKQRQIEIRRQRLQKQAGAESSIEEFRRRTTQKNEERFIANSLCRCQKVCQNLDLDADVSEPTMIWFWPEKINEPTEESNDEDDTNSPEEDEFSISEKLDMLTNYIRTSYNYCFWCGIHYESLDDLSKNCPGTGKDDH